jgi:hypothetical protein
MKTNYLTSISVLKAKAGNTFEVEQIQNKEISNSLEGMRSLLDVQSHEMKVLQIKLEQQTAVLSPTKGFSSAAYYRSHSEASLGEPGPSKPSLGLLLIYNAPSSSQARPPSTPKPASSDNLGFYIATDHTPHAFANASPKAPSTPRSKTHVDLVLPHVSAFYKPGMSYRSQ